LPDYIRASTKCDANLGYYARPDRHAGRLGTGYLACSNGVVDLEDDALAEDGRGQLGTRVGAEHGVAVEECRLSRR
jgi:hypothetical protein